MTGKRHALAGVALAAIMLATAFGARAAPNPPATAATGTAAPPPAPATLPTADRLVPVDGSDRVWTGVAVAADARIFAVFPRALGDPGPSLAVRRPDGGFVPYPGNGWNGWAPAVPANGRHRKDDKAAKDGKASKDAAALVAEAAARQFVGLSAIRLGPDGALWVLDSGVATAGGKAIPGGPKLVRIDLAQNSVSRVYPIDVASLRPDSLLDGLRFHDGHAYLGDAGAPGLVVLDLSTGSARRVLDGDPALAARRPVTIDGVTVDGPDGKPALVDADQMEVTPDGRYLYVQPLCGPMSRIPTQVLDDPKVPADALSREIAFWYDTPAVGGLAIDAQGTLYLNDIAGHAVLTLSPDRQLRTLIHDDRLRWVGAPALVGDSLYLPVSRRDKVPPSDKGKSRVEPPLPLYRLQLPGASAPATNR